MTKNILFLILVIITLFACNKKNERHAMAEKIMAEWVGKTIQFPDDLRFSVYGKDTTYSAHNTPYRILFYSDSMGCTSCKLKLYSWKHIIAEVDSTNLADKVSFIFCFQPKNKKNLIFELRGDRFQIPVIINESESFNKTNKFPSSPAYQCFLLDNENKVLLVGNPTMNPKIWDLFKQLITGKISDKQSSNTSIEIEQRVIQLANVKVREEQELLFNLKNTGKTPLIIINVKTSCGCTLAKWEKQPIGRGLSTQIKARIKIDQPGYFCKSLLVYCNSKQSPLTLLIKGIAK